MRLANLVLTGTRRISPLPFVSMLVSCTTAAVAIYAWSSLVHGQRVHLRASIDGVARECADALERQAWDQGVALRDLAWSWVRFPPRSEPEWRHDAAALMAQHPSLRSLVWVNGGERREVTADASPIRPDFGAALASAEAEVAGGSPRALVSPVRFENGSYGFVVFVGADSASGDAGHGPLPMLRATFDFETFATRAFADRASGYAFVLSSGNLAVAHGSASPAPGLDWWRASRPVSHPFGASWRVELRPTAMVAGRELSILPDVLLATGVLAAGMIGALVFATSVASRRARAMAATNLALAEIAERAQPDARPRSDTRSDLEREVRDRTEELREAVLDLEAFNVSVSHDLRSPIGAIVNLTSVLRETQAERLDAGARELLRRIESSAMRALARMDGLLDFSRLGRRALRREPADLHRMAWRIAQEIRQSEAGARVEFVLHPVPGAHGDAAMIEALLRNLLSNAAKFSRGEEKPRVEFGVLPADGSAEAVYFVRDNGVGFDPRFADKLFGLFERQHHASEFEGTGVGLAIVSRIVRRHEGRVWAESQPGKGATFFFTLGEADG
jgi:signal transduction histidine kinase